MTDRDKELEKQRYDERARARMAHPEDIEPLLPGSQTVAAYLRTPYQHYERCIARWIAAGSRVLELGAGTGLHTLSLLDTGAQVVASDISPHALALLRRRFEPYGAQLQTCVADMEQIPFGDASFDAVVSAGSLSYGEPDKVDKEIGRVLRPGGVLICVDSLNHHPVYRLNRWLHYRRGERSASTLRRMPDLARIASLGRGFEQVDTRFFGAISFLMPVVARFTGENVAQAMSDRVDTLVGARRSAFKFVLAARGFRPPGIQP